MSVILDKRSLVLGLVVSVTAAVLIGLYAGEMEPWGPPGPTMKPLFAIEPRMVVWGEMLSSEGRYRITQPGSYYLGENIDATGKWGIEIAATNVTLDLNGFALSNGWGSGIRTDPGTSGIENVVIRNGTVSGWDSHGIDIVTSLGNDQVLNVLATDNAGTGIVGSGHIIDCAASRNAIDGIHAGQHSIVRGCRALENQNNGIRVDSSSTISNSLASYNGNSGIRLWGNVLATGNICTFNGEAGIRASNHGNRIDGNQTMNNTYGIEVLEDEGYSQVMRNTAWANTIVDFAVSVNNDLGPVGRAHDSTSPWANFDD